MPEDAAAIARLAQLDSASVPVGALLLAVVDGVPVAALSTSSGEVVADPFRRTSELVAMLRDRAARLEASATVPQARRRRAAWLRTV